MDGISGHSRRNHPAAEAAVDFEVGVGGEKEWIGQDLREADQTGVGDAHRDIRVFVEEIKDRDEVVLMERGDPESSATAGKAEGGAAFGGEKVIGLGKNGLAGDPWRRMKLRLLDGPWMVLIVLPPEGDEKRSINDDGISHNLSISGIPFSVHSYR